MTAAIGLVQSGVCLPDGDWRLTKGLHCSPKNSATQILRTAATSRAIPKPCSRSPATCSSLVDAMVQRDLIIPVTIRRALDRMMPMIRFMPHGDGRLGDFNGGTEGADGWAQTLLCVRHRPQRRRCIAPHSGYHRLDCGPR